MPSSPGYQRNYKHEDSIESPQRKKEREMRVKARRAFERANGPIPAGMDVNHIKPLSKGGGNKDNLDLRKSSKNRSYPRNPDGSMKRLYK